MTERMIRIRFTEEILEGKMKKIITLILAGCIALSTTACTIEQAANSAVDLVNSLNTSDSPEVKSVKNSYLTSYSDKITERHLTHFLEILYGSILKVRTIKKLYNVMVHVSTMTRPLKLKYNFC